MLAGSLVGPAGSGAATPKPSGKKPVQQKTISKTKPATKSAKGKASGAKRSTHSRTARRVPKRSWRAGQMQPTADRYKEIQEALVKKGYLHQEPTGKWDQESIDALRRFQQEQNLNPTGKLDSLSIIALGLGPKYEAADKTPARQ